MRHVEDRQRPDDVDFNAGTDRHAEDQMILRIIHSRN